MIIFKIHKLDKLWMWTRHLATHRKRSPNKKTSSKFSGEFVGEVCFLAGDVCYHEIALRYVALFLLIIYGK